MYRQLRCKVKDAHKKLCLLVKLLSLTYVEWINWNHGCKLAQKVGMIEWGLDGLRTLSWEKQSSKLLT